MFPEGYLLVGFLWEHPADTGCDLDWPQPREYRGKLAKMLVNMVATAEINISEDAIPAPRV